MNVLLLGNGFDLYHKLPTNYINFLHVVDYLSKHYRKHIKTVGEVFGQPELQEQDHYIRACYSEHKDECDNACLDENNIKKIVCAAQNNRWFTYLIKSVQKDIKWIDFEKEIGTVLRGIQDCINEKRLHFNLFTYHSTTVHIIKHFGFFVDDLQGGTYAFSKDYLIEEPVGSKSYYIDKEKIAEELSAELYEFAEMLRLYLCEFVETVVQFLRPEKFSDECFFELRPEYVLTFNYTNTYEKLFPRTNMIHIHGSINSRIVLGINPDESDDVETANTTFLPFKKYYQRVIWKTDVGYLEFMKSLECGTNSALELYVMGHSLDVTDADIIKGVFSFSDQITIMYHNQAALTSYVTKLIELYGKKGFDRLRYEKELTFVSLETELSSLIDGIKRRQLVNRLFEQQFETPRGII